MQRMVVNEPETEGKGGHFLDLQALKSAGKKKTVAWKRKKNDENRGEGRGKFVDPFFPLCTTKGERVGSKTEFRERKEKKSPKGRMNLKKNQNRKGGRGTR